MFVHNSASLDVHLAHGHVTEELAVAALMVPLTFEVAPGDRLTSPAKPLPPGEDDPPPEILRLPLWSGVSVTASGHAAGPARAPFVSPVLFRVGAVERRLIVFGDRRWERRLGGHLEPSAPAPFDAMKLGFERAFGGGYDLPAGPLPGTDLLHPGVRVGYSFNDRGVGYYPSVEAAAGQPLPNIERPDQLVRTWDDAPEPAGFTPCPDLMAWRMKDEAAALAERAGAEDPAALLRHAFPPLRVYHHAPPSLIFDDLTPGAPIELRGLGDGAIRFAVPATAHAVFSGHRAMSRRWRIAHSVTTGGWAVLQSNWAMILVPHVPKPPGPPHPVEYANVAAIILASSAAPQLTAHSVTGEGGALCTAIWGWFGVNLDCADTALIGLSADFNPNSVMTSPTLGDYASAYISAFFSAWYASMTGGIIGGEIKTAGAALAEIVLQGIASVSVAALQTVLDVINSMCWFGDMIAIGLGQVVSWIQGEINGVSGGRGHGAVH